MLFDRMLKFMQEKLVKPAERKLNEAHDWKADGAKSCPFCGGGDWQVILPDNVSDVSGIFCVVCGKCGAQGPYKKTEKEAIEAWNKVSIGRVGEPEKNETKPTIKEK